MEAVKVSRMTDYIRQRIVTLRKMGRSYIEIVRIIEDEEKVLISKDAVGLFYRKFRATGSIHDLPRAPRRKILQEQHIQYIDQRCNADRELSAEELTRDLNIRFRLNVST